MWVQALVGEEADDLCDGFDIFVCSPSWFCERFTLGDQGKIC
jgi:hypothetical protein